MLSLLGRAAAQADLYDPAVIRTLDLRFAQTDWFAQIVKNKRSEVYIKADLRVDGKWYFDVGVRGRGATAWDGTLNRNSTKLPLKISMDEFVVGQELRGYDKLALNNGYRDPTFLREVLAMRAHREFLPAPKANFIKLTINGENWGIYINMQVVDSEFVRDWWRNDTGNRYKGAHDLIYYGPDASKWEWPIPIKTKNGPAPYVDLIRAMYTTTILPISTRVAEMPKLIDIDLAHRHEAVNIMIGNTDGLPKSNYYLYLGPYHDQLRTIPWDMNVCLTGTSNGILLDPKVFNDDELWRRRYRGYLRTAVERVLDWQVMGQWASTWHKMIDAEVKADTKKLYSYADFKTNLENGSVYISASVKISSIKSAILGRRSRFLSHKLLSGPRVQLADPTASPRQPTNSQGVTFNVRATSSAGVRQVLLHHRSRGYFRELPMFDDGNHGDGSAGDGTYGNTIPAQPAGSLVEYYFSAEADLLSGGQISCLPFHGGFKPMGFRVQARLDSVVIHEFLARNDSGIRDPHGEREDWIEMFNPTTSDIDLSGHYLTDNLAIPRMWQLPGSTIVPAGGRLLVWADKDVTQIGLHASFKLDGDGEEIVLLDKNGVEALDFSTYGPQEKDISTGSLFDTAVSPRVTFPNPTPRQANELNPCGIRRWSTLDPGRHSMSLSATGSMRLGSTVLISLTGAPSNSSYLVQFALTPAISKWRGFEIWKLTTSRLAESLFASDSLGQGRIASPVPSDSAFVGVRLSMQAFASTGTQLVASNGLEIGVCK